MAYDDDDDDDDNEDGAEIQSQEERASLARA